MSTALKELLLGLIENDKRARAEVAARGERFPGYPPRMGDVQKRNAETLDEIIEQHGWPGNSLVGEDGAQAAWLVAQRAIGDPAFQRKCLGLLKEAAAQGESEPAYVAYLEDSICFHERRPQRYGTQFEWDDSGQLSPWTLEDPERVDAYRESVGLEPLARRVEHVRRRQRAEGESPPRDIEKRRREMESWAKSVGWL